MYCLMYFDTEDFMSAPDSPVHILPARFANIMGKYGLKGSFHIIGEKGRFMERHKQRDVIEALGKHDVSLHYNRGSIHPTTAEEVSNLDWFAGVDRVMFRELPGFQSHERIFGKCSALTRHGGMFAAQIVFAAGRMGKPFFSTPFPLPEQQVGWFCNNLLIGQGAGGSFDNDYRDTPRFDQKLEQQQNFLREASGRENLVCLFGCHPVNTVMDNFPCANFYYGASPPPVNWKAPTAIPDVSIPTILENFERRIAALADFPGLEWTTVGDMSRRYSRRPVRVKAERIIEGARAVMDNSGPTYTPLLSAGELLYLLARHRMAPDTSYDIPQIMGPVSSRPEAARTLTTDADLDHPGREIIRHVHDSGYLPECLGSESGYLALEAALVLLSCDVLNTDPGSVHSPQLSVDAIPGVAEASENVGNYENWRVFGPLYNRSNILWHFRSQTWTFKPAFEENEYGPDVQLGGQLNTAFPFVNSGK